ncbi:MAG: thiol:disulfide interchange protein DsbG [Burkholderiaceae bacterium]|jgi:thiol:disulfide interchange protein DsbG
MIQRMVLVLGSAFALCGAAALADDALPKPLASLHDKGYQIEKHFDAGHGLTGWVVTRSGQSNIVYTTNDGEVLISGNLMDSQGHNLTAGFAKEYIAHVDLKPIFGELAKASYITEGGAGAPRRVIYVIFDPNCPYCSIAWRALRPYLANGVEVRWVPVAYLQDDSAARVAAILGAKDPVASLGINESQFDTQKHLGGVAPSATVPESVKELLKRNDGIMQRLGSTATPTFVWSDNHDQIQSQIGLPDPTKMLEIVGIANPG